MRLVGSALVVSLLFGASAAAAADMAASATAGKAFVEANCSRCHAVGVSGASPMAEAPPFRGMFETYAPSDLQEALAEGIVTGHPAMPEWQLQPHQVAEVIAYLETLIGN